MIVDPSRITPRTFGRPVRFYLESTGASRREVSSAHCPPPEAGRRIDPDSITVIYNVDCSCEKSNRPFARKRDSLKNGPTLSFAAMSEGYCSPLGMVMQYRVVPLTRLCPRPAHITSFFDTPMASRTARKTPPVTRETAVALTPGPSFKRRGKTRLHTGLSVVIHSSGAPASS